MLAARCGPQHIRNHQKIPDEEYIEVLKEDEKMDEAPDIIVKPEMKGEDPDSRKLKKEIEVETNAEQKDKEKEA